jgi:outer membrane protein OmpA-like peptidoglycan-associated protein
MRRPRRPAVLLAVSAAVTAAVAGVACGAKKIPPVDPRGRDQVVLLPDADSGTTGRSIVSSGADSIELSAPRQSTMVAVGQAPSPVTVLSESDVRRIFGNALAALPPAPTHFTLFYRFDSDELTDESRALVPKILDAVKSRPVPEVMIIGHTDTIGTAASNEALGMRRAIAVKSMLVEAGLDESFLEVTSHGEADLLIRTGDNVAEPRNRRVEITVR